MDDAYLGGERNGGKAGQGSENKQPFVIAVSTDEHLEHPTFAVIEPVRAFDNTSMIDWRERRLAKQAEIYSDGLFCFRRFADANHAHTVLETEGGRVATEVKGARWVNVLLGNLKRAMSGRYQTGQICATLSGRSGVSHRDFLRSSIQSPFSIARHAAATVARNGCL